jgi:hypothetical protein
MTNKQENIITLPQADNSESRPLTKRRVAANCDLSMSDYQTCRSSSQCKWPRLMRTKTAADYVDERSMYAFRRAVGTLWPKPVQVSGKGKRWLKDDLDIAIEKLACRKEDVRDAADVL